MGRLSCSGGSGRLCGECGFSAVWLYRPVMSVLCERVFKGCLSVRRPGHCVRYEGVCAGLTWWLVLRAVLCCG